MWVVSCPHWKGALASCRVDFQVFERYLQALLVFWGDNIDMWGYVDSDYGGDRDNGMSITWYIFTVGGTTVSWIYRLQKIVVLFSIEVE